MCSASECPFSPHRGKLAVRSPCLRRGAFARTHRCHHLFQLTTRVSQVTVRMMSRSRRTKHLTGHASQLGSPRLLSPDVTVAFRCFRNLPKEFKDESFPVFCRCWIATQFTSRMPTPQHAESVGTQPLPLRESISFGKQPNDPIADPSTANRCRRRSPRSARSARSARSIGGQSPHVRFHSGANGPQHSRANGP